MRDTYKTKVVFRVWGKGHGHTRGAVIALFPEEEAGRGHCNSYEHVGQHGSAEPVGLIQRTKPAKPAEYADLMAELKNIGYNDLKVYQKLQSDFLEERRRKLAEIASPSRQVLPETVTGPTSLKKWAKSRQKRKSKRASSPTSLRGLR